METLHTKPTGHSKNSTKWDIYSSEYPNKKWREISDEQPVTASKGSGKTEKYKNSMKQRDGSSLRINRKPKPLVSLNKNRRKLN